MDKRIATLKGHYIVCGIGRIGRHIIDELLNTGRPFVAIDANEEICKYLGSKGIFSIKGDATSSAVLKAANAEHAKGVFCSLHTDADNLLLILTVKGIHPGLKIVAKAEENESENKMKKAGADGVVLPEFMLKSEEDVFRVEDIMIADSSQLAGKTLKSSGILDKDGITVVAVRKGEKHIFNPPPDEMLETGNALILIGETKRVREIKNLVG